jgi:hypothetical protein
MKNIFVLRNFMQWNLKKTWLGLAAPLAMLTSMLSAANNDAQVRNLENRVSALEQRKGASGMMNPPANPTIRRGVDLSVFGDLLYWSVNQQGMPLAVVNKGTPDNLRDARIENLRGKWDVGSRIGIGYVIPHDGWDVDLTWLHFNTGSHKKILHSSSKKFIFGSMVPSTDPYSHDNAAHKGEGKWNLYFNQLDLDLGREFFVSRWLTLRPHGGVRADWLRQRIHSKLKNFTPGFPLPNEVNTNYKDRWWGIGIESGIDTQWGLGAGWSIFCDLAAAILYGRHHITLRDNDHPPITNFADFATSLPSGKYAKVKENLRRVAQPILDLQLGLRWDWKFNGDRLHLGLQVGWENHVYFNQNQFPFFCDGTNFGKFFANQGDLSMQGWSFGARFDF